MIVGDMFRQIGQKIGMKFGSSNDKMQLLLAATLLLVIAISLISLIHSCTGGGLGGREGRATELHFWCTEANKEFTIKSGDMRMEEEMYMIENPSSYRVMSPYSGKKTGIQMIRCPNPDCKKYYVPDAWKEGRGGMYDPREKIVCPHCGTDRNQWYRERRKRRKKR
jgi:hypothetical protein